MKKSKPFKPVIKYLDDVIVRKFGGSRAQFAENVAECSRSQMSRIMNGEQELTKEMVERIARHPDIDEKELLELWRSAYDNLDFCVPIASCLLPKSPRQSKQFLTQRYAEMPPSKSAPSVYAIRARDICNRDSSRARPLLNATEDDLIFVDTQVRDFKANLNFFDGKHVAIKDGGPEAKTISLTQLWVVTEGNKTVLKAAKTPAKSTGRERRLIKLGDGNTNTETETETVDFKQIVGVVILMIREEV